MAAVRLPCTEFKGSLVARAEEHTQEIAGRLLHFFRSSSCKLLGVASSKPTTESARPRLSRANDTDQTHPNL